MRLYASAFREIAGEDSLSIVVCGGQGSEEFPAAGFIYIDECDYRTYSTSDHFFRVKDLLKRRLNDLLHSKDFHLPAAVLWHNMSLGKNPALSSALAEVAREWSGEGVRFYSVIHDFAEEGRVEQLRSLQVLESAGVDIMPDLYALGSPVRHLVPGSEAFEILRKAGFSVTLFPNPAEKSEFSDDAVSRDSVLKRASVVNASIDPSKPLCVYPSRVIFRKNPLEAIVLGSLILGCNLFLGAPGTSRADLGIFRDIGELVEKYRLKVILDAGKLITGQNQDIGNPVPLLYAASDLALSASLAEGFGYGLYEPWLYGKAVIARRPAHFSYPDEMDSSFLYTRLPVLSKWISLERYREKYRSEAAAAGVQFSDEEFEKIVINGTIDFGILDWDTQVDILCGAAEDKARVEAWKRLLSMKLQGWPGLGCFDNIEGMVKRNESVMHFVFSRERFLERFRECFSTSYPVVTVSGDYRMIRQLFYKEKNRFSVQRL